MGGWTYPTSAELLDNVNGAVGTEDVVELDDVHVVEGLFLGGWVGG